MEPFTIAHSDGTVEVLYDPHPKQQEFHARTEPNVLMYGGRGSGKSLALRWEAHMRALSTPNFHYCILRRTYPELEKSHLIFLPQEMTKLGGHFHRANKIASYPNGSKGFFSHCSNDEDMLNLLSAQFAWMGFDELSTFEWEMFSKLAASVRVPKGSGLTAMVRAATNPLGPSSGDILRYFVDKSVTFDEDEHYRPQDWCAIKANAVDNPSLDLDQYTKRLGSGLASHVRKAWVDGDFALENALFDLKPTIKIMVETGEIRLDGEPVMAEKTIPYHIIPTLDRAALIEASEIFCAFDMGYFPDPAYCLWIAHLGNRYVAFHEKPWLKTIAGDIALDILEESKRLGIIDPNKSKRIISCYCDPSININTGADIQTIKDIMEAKGLPMECSINNRELYAQAIHTALAEEASHNVPRLQIYSKGCPYLTKTLPQMRFNPKRPLAMDDHKDDHPTVALAYFLISSGSMEHRNFSQKNTPRWLQVRPGRSRDNLLGNEGVRRS